MPPPPGLLVAIEGTDGSGTTTQAQRLAGWLASRGRAVHATREPSAGAVGQLIRRILSGETSGDGSGERAGETSGERSAEGDGGACDPRALALLFAADRLEHLRREIEPARRTGAVVLTDRYVLSSLVYQGLAVEPAFVAEINRFAPAPDLTLFLDVPAEVAAARRARRGGAPELFESDETQRRVIESYRREAARLRTAGEPIVIVDGTPDPQAVFAALRTPLAELCGLPLEEP